jgi:hypothetical protein
MSKFITYTGEVERILTDAYYQMCRYRVSFGVALDYLDGSDTDKSRAMAYLMAELNQNEAATDLLPRAIASAHKDSA